MKHHSNSGEYMDLSNGGNCAVGEANLFSNEYWAEHTHDCQPCAESSTKFYNIVKGHYDNLGSRKKQILAEIKVFTTHWKDKHNPLIDTIPETEPSAITVKTA